MNDTAGKFKIETVFKGLKSPTDKVFLDPKNPDDIIVLEKIRALYKELLTSYHKMVPR